MERRTKIIATIGPASDSESDLRKIIDAGMDVARLGLAHGTLDEAIERYQRIRQVSSELSKRVGILVDLPGPKIRSAAFSDDGAELTKNSEILIVPGSDGSDEKVIQVGYENVLGDLLPGDVIPFGDGQVVVRVENVTASN